MRKFIALFGALSIGVVFFIAMSPPVSASFSGNLEWSETDERLIDYTGSEWRELNSFQASSQSLPGEGLRFSGGFEHVETGCVETFYLTLDSPEATSGTIEMDTQDQISGPDPPPRCAFVEELVERFPMEVSVSGARAEEGERDEETAYEKTVRFTINLPVEPEDKPERVELTISGDADRTIWAELRGVTDQASYETDIELEAGNYEACVTSPPDVIECTTFEKIEYSSRSITMGQSYASRQINVRVFLTRTDIGGDGYVVGPVDLVLLNESGTPVAWEETNQRRVEPVSETNDPGVGGITRTSTTQLRANFEDIEEGQYEICIRDTEICEPTEHTVDGYITMVTINLSEAESSRFITLDSEPEPEGAQCEVEGGLAGWIACSALTWTLDRMEDVQTWMVEVLFETSPLVVGDTDDPLYQTWSNIRNVANSLLIIAFMAVIFSLAMSLNVDAYTVKRMVPRLLIAAVTIQASYFISAIFVDITNILGSGLQDLTDIAMSGVRGSFDGVQSTGGWIALGSIAALMFKGALLAVPVIGLLLIGLLLIFFGAFLIIALRDLFIIAAVVLSPLAFLANLLPNTERWFKFWWSNFARLLLMYPFIILMIQLGNLGAYMVLFDNRGNAIEGFLAPFMAILMQGAAIISIYFAFKVGGSILSASTNGFQKLARRSVLNTKIGAQTKEKFSSRINERKSEYAAGARGNRGTRAVVAPSSRATRKSRALATAELERNTAAAGKELEEAGVTDPEILKELSSPYGNSSDALKRRIRQLHKEGDTEAATKLERALPYAGKRSHQAAALKAAASSPFVGGNMNESFSNADSLFENNPEFRDKLKLDAAVEANKAGRKDIWSEHGPAPADQVVKGLSSEDISRMHASSFDPQNSPEFIAELRREVAKPESQTRNSLRSAMGPHGGMSADKHARLKRALMDEHEAAQYKIYEQQLQEARRRNDETAQRAARRAMESAESSLYRQINSESQGPV